MSNMQDDEGAQATAKTEKKQKPWLFQPGQSGNPKGRTKGARQKLGEDFINALRDDFNANGPKVIEEVRTKRPHEYLKVIASILPKEMTVNTRSVEEMDDDELAAALAALRSLCFASDARAGTAETALN